MNKTLLFFKQGWKIKAMLIVKNESKQNLMYKLKQNNEEWILKTFQSCEGLMLIIN